MSGKENVTGVNQLKIGSLLSYVNIIISCIIPIFYTPIMLSILGQSEYGTYALANSVIGYLSLLNLGMANSVVRYVTKFRCKKDHEGVERITGLFVSIYCIMAILVIVCGLILVFVSDDFFAKGLSSKELLNLKQLMVIMTCSTAITFPAVTFSALAIAYEKYIFRRLLEIVGTILPPILNIVVLILGYGNVGIACVGLVIQVLLLPVYIIYCDKKLDIRPRFNHMPFYLLKEIFSYTFFIFLSMIVDMLYWATDKVLIGAMIGTTAVAIYNIGGTFTNMLQSMASAISSVFVPRVMTMVENKEDVSVMSELFIRIGRLQYLIVAFVLSGYVVFGRSFIHFWAGDGYSKAYDIALLTMIPLMIPLIQNVAYNVILAQNKHQFRAILYAALAVINLISTIIAIPRFGIIGAAVCTAAAFVVGNGFIMNWYYYVKIGLDIPNFWKNIIQLTYVPVIVSIVYSILINYLMKINSIFNFLTHIIVYTIIYIVCSICFSMNKYEKNLIFDIIKKVIKH